MDDDPTDDAIHEAIHDAIHDAIDYDSVVATWRREASSKAASAGLGELHEFLLGQLPDLWCESYEQMPGSSAEIVGFEDHGFRFLFDQSAERVVAAFGVSAPSSEARDSSRMAAFLGKAPETQAPTAGATDSRSTLASMNFRDRFFLLHGDSYDRGHFMSHRQGGGLDVNLFPQRSDINQGRSSLGREYRAMERRCASRPGVFCFSRPIYRDLTWVPAELEYGLVERAEELEVRRFPN